MSIRTKIILFIFVACGLTAGTAFILIDVQSELATYYERENANSRISKEVFELSLLSTDYFNNPLKRTRRQWDQKYDSLLKTIDTYKHLYHAESAHLEEVERSLSALKVIFTKLVDQDTFKQEKGLAGQYDSVVLLYEARLATISHDIISKFNKIGTLTHVQLESSHEKSNRIVICLFVLFSMLIALLSWLVIFNILKPLSLLKAGLVSISEGGFDYNVDVKRNDEIGFIAHAFNEMTEGLRTETVHRSELEKEIIERKEAERKILESEELFRAVFEQAGGYCMILQPTESGIPDIVDANEAACRSHGYTREEMIGMPVANLDDEEGKRLCIERTKLIMSGKPFVIETTHIRKDGSRFPVAVYANTVHFEGKAPLIVTTEIDISERKDAEAEKIMLEKKLQQAQKMESIGTLAGGIAHDFNNILSSIIGFSDLALGSVERGSELESDLSEINRAGKRASELVKQILLFARKSDEKIYPLKIKPIIKETLKLLRASIPTNIELLESIESNLAIMGNETHVHQIFMNLGTNAAQSMERNGGEIKFSVTDVTLEQEVKSKDLFLQPGGYVKIEVSDTGPGIPQDIIPSIFEPYFSTKETGEGTGLGLATVHGIVDKYSGQIQVKSTVGEGTTFSIFIPARQRQLNDAKEEENNFPGGSESILLVDDEIPITKMNKRLLHSLGYNAVEVNCSVEALKILKNSPDDYDLIVTDMTMPLMTGDKLAAEILKIRPSLPIILCTGYSEVVSKKEAQNVGIRAYIEKPIEKATFTKLIRDVLDDKT